MVKCLVYLRHKRQNVVWSNDQLGTELIRHGNEIFLGEINTIMSIEKRIKQF